MPASRDQTLRNLLNQDRISIQTKLESKTVLLKQLASLIVRSPQVRETWDDIVNKLLRRELLGSTVAYPEGQIAIPHARLESVSTPSGALLLLKKPLSFDDSGHKVRIVLGLVLPEKKNDTHQFFLDKLIEYLKETDACASILTAQSPSDILHLMREINLSYVKSS